MEHRPRRGLPWVAIHSGGSERSTGVRPVPSRGQQPWSLVTLGFRGEKIETLTCFLHTQRIFPTFGLSPTLES